jgi:ABC-type nitrate/sulfonate/bicarbonate transport system ATPase subunit
MASESRGASALRIDGVGKVYMSRQGWVDAVVACTLEVEPGRFCVLVGPSGCGKTTLLNIVAGFDKPTSGEVRLGERVIAARNMSLRPGPDRMVVFQHGGLFPWMTVLENVCYGPIRQRLLSDKDASEVARGMLSKVGLASIEKAYPGNISSGMRRRVEIVRALISRPRILLMDEPFRALDALTKSVMHDFLLRLYDAQPYSVFFITHDLLEAIYLGDSVAVMTTRPGRIKHIFEVDLPRPRSHRVLATREFLRLKDDVTEAVHEEAVKAFVAGERELAR